MAKLIVGHISRTLPEIVEILLKGGTYSCPTLPHYRYSAVQSHCTQLRKRGLIEKSGRADVSINFKPTALLREWKSEFDAGITTLGPIKWVKQKMPPKVRHKVCDICGVEFDTINPGQKRCSKQCKPMRKQA